MGEAKTDAELVVEVIELAEDAHETIKQVRELVAEAITKYLVVGHPVDRDEMAKLLRSLNLITEEYAE